MAEQPTSFCLSTSKFRSIVDSHVQNRLPDEVKENITNMFVKFQQQQDSSFQLGLEHLIVDVLNILPSTNTNSFEINGANNETMVHDEEITRNAGSDSASKGGGSHIQVPCSVLADPYVQPQAATGHNHSIEVKNCGNSVSALSRAVTSQAQAVAHAHTREPQLSANPVLHHTQEPQGSQVNISDLGSKEITVAQVNVPVPAIVQNDTVVPFKKRKYCQSVSPLDHSITSHPQAAVGDLATSVVVARENHRERKLCGNPVLHHDPCVPQGLQVNVADIGLKTIIKAQVSLPSAAASLPLNSGSKDLSLPCLKGPLDPKLRALYEWQPSFELPLDDVEQPVMKDNGTSTVAGHGHPTSFVASHSAHVVAHHTTTNHAPDSPIIDLCSDEDVQGIHNSSKRPRQDPLHDSKEIFDKNCRALCNNTENIYNLKNSFVSEGIGCSYLSIGNNQLNRPANASVLQPLDINVLQSGYRGGTVSSTCELPVYGQRRQVMPSRFTSSPFVTDYDKCDVSLEEISYYYTAIDMARGEHRSRKAFSMRPEEKSYVTFQCLAYSLKPDGKVDNYLVNSFIRILFEDYHPYRSKKHYFFSSVGQHFLKDESSFKVDDVLRELLIAHKLKSLQSCEMIYFPILYEMHWFLFIVDIKDRRFVVLDTLHGEQSLYHGGIRTRLINNFSKAFHEVAKRTSLRPAEFDVVYPKVHTQTSDMESGVFILIYLELWHPRVAVESCFKVADIPKIRIKLLNRIMRSKYNTQDLTWFDSLVKKWPRRYH